MCQVFLFGVSAGAVGQNNTFKFSAPELRKLQKGSSCGEGKKEVAIVGRR
jgi:hypothetical protein